MVDLTDDRALWDWHAKAMAGNVERHTISIILRDVAGAEQIRWTIKNAWPTKWTGPTLDASANDVSIEALELAHEGLEVQKW